MIVGKKGWGVIPPPVGYSESVLLRDEQIDDHHQHCQDEEDRKDTNDGCEHRPFLDRIGCSLGSSVSSDHSVNDRHGHSRDHDNGNNYGNDIASEVFVLSHCQHLQFLPFLVMNR